MIFVLQTIVVNIFRDTWALVGVFVLVLSCLYLVFYIEEVLRPVFPAGYLRFNPRFDEAIAKIL